MTLRTGNRRFGLGPTCALSLLAALSYLCLRQPAAIAEVEREDNSRDLAQSGVPLYEWKDSSVAEPKAIVVAIHGAAQQGAALEAFARRLAALGYLVVAPDLRGGGRWRTLPEQHKAMGGAYGEFQKSCIDLETILDILRQEHKKSQIFCVGESAGATVVLTAVNQNSARVKGIVLCASGCEPHLHNPANMGAGFIGKLLKVDKPVDMSNYITRYSSDDQRVGQEMVADPLSRNSLSAIDLIGTLNFITQAPTLAHELPKSIPVLVMQGQEDQIVNANSANKVFSAFKTSDKNILMLPGCGHVLIGTTFLKSEVYNPIARWLAGHGGLPVGNTLNEN
jgi:acylglycerol lipase